MSSIHTYPMVLGLVVLGSACAAPGGEAMLEEEVAREEQALLGLPAVEPRAGVYQPTNVREIQLTPETCAAFTSFSFAPTEVVVLDATHYTAQEEGLPVRDCDLFSRVGDCGPVQDEIVQDLTPFGLDAVITFDILERDRRHFWRSEDVFYAWSGVRTTCEGTQCDLVFPGLGAGCTQLIGTRFDLGEEAAP